MSALRNVNRVNPLTPAQIKRRKKWDQLVLSLEPRKQGGINHPINTGPLKVCFGSGVMASV